jgi:transcriptional regulator with XRE-family HTH domain
MGKLYQGGSPEIQDDDIEINSPSNDDQNAGKLTDFRQRKSIVAKKASQPVSKLRALRKAKGFTLEQLAELATISPSYLSRLEAGDRRLNTDLIHKLSSVLHCPSAELLDDEGWQSEAGADLLGGKLPSVSPHKDLPVYKLSAVQEFENIPRDDVNPSPEILYLHRDNPIDWIYRPMQLAQVTSAFAVYIGSSHFGTTYKEGEQILIHPSKPLSKNCSILVIYQDDSILLGQFDGWFGDSLHLISYGASIGLFNVQSHHKDQLKAVYRIIGTLESP